MSTDDTSERHVFTKAYLLQVNRCFYQTAYECQDCLLGAVKPSNCDPDQIIVLKTGVDFPWHILPAGQITAVMFHELQFINKLCNIVVGHK